jgi:hypothetical protein
MRPHGKAKLGFFPLPVAEAERLRNCLAFPPQFSALDPFVGDGVAFTHLLEGTHDRRYGIEIDAYRAEQAARLGIDTLQANTSDVRCPAETLSLLYLNPPYDFETGQTNNQRLGFGVSAAHLSLAEARRRPCVRHSTAAIETVREDVERALYRSGRV